MRISHVYQRKLSLHVCWDINEGTALWLSPATYMVAEVDALSFPLCWINLRLCVLGFCFSWNCRIALLGSPIAPYLWVYWEYSLMFPLSCVTFRFIPGGTESWANEPWHLKVTVTEQQTSRKSLWRKSCRKWEININTLTFALIWYL